MNLGGDCGCMGCRMWCVMMSSMKRLDKVQLGALQCHVPLWNMIEHDKWYMWSTSVITGMTARTAT